MHRIDSSTATPDNRFTEGDPTIPIPATTVRAAWLNSVQEELIAILAAAGIAPDKAKNTQVVDAINALIPDKFVVGEFYYFRHPTLKPGFAPLQGGLISGAYQGRNITEWPIWEYLQTTEGQKLCKTESQWQAMTTATWHTNADGSKIGWEGIGGAPFYVQNLAAGTLRMPDIRGMYAAAAGFDALGVGDVAGDKERRTLAQWAAGWAQYFIPTYNTSGAVYTQTVSANQAEPAGGVVTTQPFYVNFDNARVVPVGKANAPRSWGALACGYLGTPAS